MSLVSGPGSTTNTQIVNERDERCGTIPAGSRRRRNRCDGSAQLLVHPASDLPDELWDQIEVGRPVVLASIIQADGQPGAGVVVVQADGSTAGTLGSTTLDASAAEAGSELLTTDRRSRERIEISGDTLLLDKVVPRTRVVVVGAGELGPRRSPI